MRNLLRHGGHLTAVTHQPGGRSLRFRFLSRGESGVARPVQVSVNTAQSACAVMALMAGLSFSARSQEAPGDLARRGYAPAPYGPRYEPQARQGLLLSIGMGGGSLYLSNQGPGRVGAADFDFRLGYGFSDRFQMFMDFNADGGTNYYGDDLGTWTWTVRAQTLLAGDRR